MITRNGWYRGIVERILIDDDGMDILFAFIFFGGVLIRGTQYGSNEKEGRRKKRTKFDGRNESRINEYWNQCLMSRLGIYCTVVIIILVLYSIIRTYRS